MGIAIASGDLIRQKYRVERVLGEGGMGVVVAAWHLHLERRVAIKFLLPEMLVHPGVVERFLREGRAASAIEGEHVAKVIDVDTLDDGTPYLVMEHLEGFDLAHLVEIGAELPVGRVVAWVIEACEAVAQAHRLGIVHRDLKPSNLFLATGRDGSQRVKVLDFGISKVVETGNRNLTRTSIGMGSAEYMSPEQCLSARDVDGRADIWALGVILYELLTMRVPYRGDNATQIYAHATEGPPDSPRALRPDVPAGLDAAILGCLEKDVTKRIPTIAALVEKLAPYAGAEQGVPYEIDRGGSAVVSGVGQPHDPTMPNAADAPEVQAQAPLRNEGLTVADVSVSRRPAGRRSWPTFVVGALALSVVAGTALLLARRGPSQQAAPVPVATVTATTPPALPPPEAPASAVGPVVLPASLASASAAASASGAPAAAPAAPRSSAVPRAATSGTATKPKAYDPTKEM